MIDKEQKTKICKLAERYSLGSDKEALRLASFSAAMSLLTFPHLTGLREGVYAYRQYEACFAAADLLRTLFGFTPSDQDSGVILAQLKGQLTIAAHPPKEK